MNRRVSAFAVLALSIPAVVGLAPAQSLTETTLKIDVQNAIEYQGDVDSSQFATKPGITPSSAPRNFYVATAIADIVAVNGQPAKGAYVGRSSSLILSPAPTGAATSEAIADVTRAALRDHVFEILQANGTSIGSIMSVGLSGGPAPPGMPSTERANWAIVGGTGAFLGARGTVGGTGGSGRAASMAEDPANRRVNGGTSYSLYIHLIPAEAPQIIQTANGPAVTHSSDFSLVTSAKPAIAGEVLSLFATGLGPTVPEVDSGLPFPSSPPANVNSPVTVTINGQTAEVLGAVGYPGATDGYQVNFRVPSGTAKGVTSLQLGAAWIVSTPVTLNVQ
jgi:hypothetical protein